MDIKEVSLTVEKLLDCLKLNGLLSERDDLCVISCKRNGGMIKDVVLIFEDRVQTEIRTNRDESFDKWLDYPHKVIRIT